MMRLRTLFLASAFLAMTAGTVSAAPAKKAPKEDPSYSKSIKFVSLNGSQQDSAINEKIFAEMVNDALTRNGVTVNTGPHPARTLMFAADYVYRAGDVDYRFLALRAAVRNAAGHATCDNSNSAWWGGASGGAQLGKVLEKELDAFLKRCL